jgi:peptidoglycan hydrolase-like protein with peptidoglycan-binding domain
MALVANATPPVAGTWTHFAAHTGLLTPIELGTYAGIQRALNALGATPPLDVDNEPGSLTEAAIMAFQKLAKLTVDGAVGPETRFALTEALAGTGPQHIGAY